MKDLTSSQEAGIIEWIESIDEEYAGYWIVKLCTRRGRMRDRILVLTSLSFHIINIDRYLYSIFYSIHSLNPINPHLNRLEEEEASYQPKSVSLMQITEILVPQVPETSFIACTTRVLHGRDRFHFVAPDRESIIAMFKTLTGNLGNNIKVRGVQED